MVLRRGKTRGASLSVNALLFFASLCFFSTSALFSINCNEKACLDGGRKTTVFLSQTKEIGRVGELPGSDPPRCTYKCGECTPCSPVHVPVPPGTTVTSEYYPEAWLCKCGKKFFMP